MANARAIAPRARDSFGCRVLRPALDWLGHLYDVAVDLDVWAVLASAEFLPSLPLAGGTLSPRRKGPPDANATNATFVGDGLYVRVRNPNAPPVSGQYPVEVQYQGLLLSTADHGLEAVPAVRAVIEALLFPGRSDDIAEHCRPGQFHVSMDVVFEGNRDRSTEWIEKEFFAGGHVDRACEVMSTRVRKKSRKQIALLEQRDDGAKPATTKTQTRILGTEASGRTWYYGRQWYGYETDKDPGRDAPIVKDTWKRAGWNGRDRVLRLEWRVTREWLANNLVHVRPDAAAEEPYDVALDKMTWEGFVAWLPCVVRALVGRMRHTDRRDTKGRVFERRSSRLWRAIEIAAKTWQPVPDPVAGWGVAQINAVQRAVTEERARKRFATAIADLRAVRTTDRPADIASREATLYECGESPIASDVLEQREARTARRLGLAPPITLAAWHVLAEQRRLERGAELSRVIPPTVYESAIH